MAIRTEVRTVRVQARDWWADALFDGSDSVPYELQLGQFSSPRGDKPALVIYGKEAQAFGEVLTEVLPLLVEMAENHAKELVVDEVEFKKP